MKNDENKRSVYKGLVLYPLEDFSHKQALVEIQKNYKYKAIVHDKDVDEFGKIKKSHVHVVLKLDSTMPNKTIADNLGITPNYVQCIVSLKGALDYLTHKYTQDKYQYSEEELFGDLEIYDSQAEKEDNKFKELFSLCYEQKPKNLTELIALACANDLLEPLRKNSYIFTQWLKSTF